VTLTDRSGRQWVGEAGVNRGDDAYPYTEVELTDKFMDLCGRIWPQAHASELLETTHALCAGQASLPEWLGLLGHAPRD
jgi:hypothetical protein